jgi:hypothetical protein
MARVSVPSMGPYAKWVDRFIEISAKAFTLLESIKCPEPTNFESLSRKTLFDLSVMAETTSICMQFAVSHSLQVPAFALTRVRLEQCIVSSFLIHAPEEEGMRRYLNHLPIQMYDVAKKRGPHFGFGAVTASVERQAREAQQVLAPRGEFKDGRFERTWSRLKLWEMAKQRDALAKNSSPLPWPLEDEYWRLYPLTSLFVHGASETVVELGELHEPELGSGKHYPYMVPRRAREIMGAVAKLDLIQAYETLSRLDGGSLRTIQPLVEAYRRQAAR